MPQTYRFDLYAKTSRSCGENTGDTQNDEFTKRVGYWAAIEKYQYAKRIDSSFAEDANKKIEELMSEDRQFEYEVQSITDRIIKR